ncbi:hypothetical protein JQ625_28220 [Bradyrhizobium diazoefficiens]|nr:hypothetical protein [Bradyrhizobium diazoefficiens]MBR0778731.1 hypothetical protein [Bradyrhizobium diazoefficiens]
MPFYLLIRRLSPNQISDDNTYMVPLAPTYDQGVAEITEADATAYARQLACMVRDEKLEWCGLPLNWFDKVDNHAATRKLIERLAVLSPDLMLDLPHLARAGWGLAHEALLKLHVQYEHEGKPRPPALAAYIQELAAGRTFLHVPSKKQEDNFLRKIAITFIVGSICERFKLKPTRSSRSRPSGCSIVAKALAEERMAIGEDAVTAIWAQLGKVAFPAEFRAGWVQ